eukprot:tig00000492_g1408.t1
MVSAASASSSDADSAPERILLQALAVGAAWQLLPRAHFFGKEEAKRWVPWVGRFFTASVAARVAAFLFWRFFDRDHLNASLTANRWDAFNFYGTLTAVAAIFFFAVFPASWVSVPAFVGLLLACAAARPAAAVASGGGASASAARSPVAAQAAKKRSAAVPPGSGTGAGVAPGAAGKCEDLATDDFGDRLEVMSDLFGRLDRKGFNGSCNAPQKRYTLTDSVKITGADAVGALREIYTAMRTAPEDRGAAGVLGADDSSGSGGSGLDRGMRGSAVTGLPPPATCTIEDLAKLPRRGSVPLVI